MSSKHGYLLTHFASDDLREIVSYLAAEAGEAIAAGIEDELFACFERLATHPGMGHRRSDLTPLPVFFFPLYPYLIVYQRNISPILIHAILHSARDVKRTLKTRTFK